MWLLKTESPTLELVEFMGDVSEPYAILSHTWGHDEVLFRDIGEPNRVHRAGYEKIMRSVSQARHDGFKYLWVDTCCIDKASSAELSEAINSMYFWYSRAAVCYAYLADVETVTELEDSRWFRRGWTLQELIAPEIVHFFSKQWNFIGDKVTLSTDVAAITGIEPSILNGKVQVSAVSVAKRMSWAARRQTTRIEDMAYCLLGIFNVNMPLLYGEREKAFIRLQEEILKTTNDQSIFAWKDDEAGAEELRGMLATTPIFFHGSAAISTWIDPDSRSSAAVVNGRLDVELRLQGDHTKARWACLSCSTFDSFERPLAIKLKQVSEQRNEYARVACDTLISIPVMGTLMSVNVPQIRTSLFSPAIRVTPHYNLTLGKLLIETSKYEIDVIRVKCHNNFAKDDNDQSLDPAILTIGQWWKRRGHHFHFMCNPIYGIHAVKVTILVKWSNSGAISRIRGKQISRVQRVIAIGTSGLLIANEFGADFEIINGTYDLDPVLIRDTQQTSQDGPVLIRCTTRPTLITCEKPFVSTVVDIYICENPNFTQRSKAG